jgi:hypothetical protein
MAIGPYTTSKRLPPVYPPVDPNDLQWILSLNDMRFSHVEELIFVCWAYSIEELKEFVNQETVEYYKDDKWGKTFRKFGPLEWYNRPWEHDEGKHFLQAPPTVVVHGILEYRAPLMVNLPSIQDLIERAQYEHPKPATRFERIAFNLVE